MGKGNDNDYYYGEKSMSHFLVYQSKYLSDLLCNGLIVINI